MSQDQPKSSHAKDVAVDAVLGLTPEKKEIFMGILRRVFKSQGMALQGREKTETEAKIIDEILGMIPDFLAKYAITTKAFTEVNIHLKDLEQFPPETRDYLKSKNAGGQYLPLEQGVELYENHKSYLEFAHRVIHELLHGTSYVALINSKANVIGQHRVGLTVRGLDKSGEGFVYFNNLNEAVIETLAIRFDTDYFPKMPSLEKEVKIRDEYLALPKLSPEDRIDVAQAERIDVGWKAYKHVYENERAEMWKLIKQIHEKNSDRYPQEEDVFRVLVRATFTGENHELIGLINSTLGDGAFIKLGKDTGYVVPTEDKKEIKNTP